MLALTHVPSPNLERCLRTFVAPAPLDYSRAVGQHEAYCRMLRKCGAGVRTLAVNSDLPDCVFIEDTAIVLDELAVLASMAAPSRYAEPAGIEPELRKYREVEHFELVRVPDTESDAANVALVGASVCLPAAHPRTAELISQLGFKVQTVDVSEFAKAEGCVTCLSILLND